MFCSIERIVHACVYTTFNSYTVGIICHCMRGFFKDYGLIMKFPKNHLNHLIQYLNLNCYKSSNCEERNVKLSISYDYTIVVIILSFFFLKSILSIHNR